jgi:hypothetical protein
MMRRPLYTMKNLAGKRNKLLLTIQALYSAVSASHGLTPRSGTFPVDTIGYKMLVSLLPNESRDVI